MLQKRALAWKIALAIMLASLLLGNFLSYRQMRSSVVATFRQEIEPHINHQLQLLHNMQHTLVLGGQGPDIYDTAAMVVWEINRIVEEMATMQMSLSWQTAIVDRAHIAYTVGQGANLNDRDAQNMRRYLLEIEERELMIRQQAEYNIIAEEFNRNMSNGLFFFTNNQLPVFN